MDRDSEFRTRLRESFAQFRRRAGTLAAEIPIYLKDLTVHDITHIDALWQLADMIIGDYEMTPTECYVLGGAILLHDLGLALASYPGGVAEVQEDRGWKDIVFQLFRRAHGRSPSLKEMASLDRETIRRATEQVLRLKHAEHAEELAMASYRDANGDTAYPLIEDADLRQTYGRLIGEIAYSHWWAASELPGRFENRIGAFPGNPADWTVDALKLALIVAWRMLAIWTHVEHPHFFGLFESRWRSRQSTGDFRNTFKRRT